MSSRSSDAFVKPFTQMAVKCSYLSGKAWYSGYLRYAEILPHCKSFLAERFDSLWAISANNCRFLLNHISKKKLQVSAGFGLTRLKVDFHWRGINVRSTHVKKKRFLLLFTRQWKICLRIFFYARFTYVNIYASVEIHLYRDKFFACYSTPQKHSQWRETSGEKSGWKCKKHLSGVKHQTQTPRLFAFHTHSVIDI